MTPAERRRAEAAARNAAVKAAHLGRFAGRPTWARREPKRAARVGPLVAYDFETTAIAEGTPRPLWLTVYAPGLIDYAGPIHSMAHLRAELVTHLLVPELHGARFCAWNGNRFDGFFIAAALARSTDHLVRPYLTASGSLRGLRVTLAADGDTRTGRAWEFLDGLAMTGLAGTKLDKFLSAFAPDHRKLDRGASWEDKPFDVTDLRDQAYARRDSVGLWHGMTRAESILVDTFGEPLRTTIGAACVRIFERNIPAGVRVEPLPADAREVMRRYALRGGFVYCARPYRGPVWKYDLNQAYCAAMREAGLPDGGVLRGRGAPHPKTAAYLVRLRAELPGNRVPFYFRTGTDRVRTVYSGDTIDETWLTDIEHRQLVAEGWRIECFEHYAFPRVFSMIEFVDRLELLRTTCEGGPKGPIGTMVKAVGNNAYGKTAEETLPLDFLISSEPPDVVPAWQPYYGDGFAPIHHVWHRIQARRAKAYQQPQLSAWITAHVRMVLRRAALLDPDAWLYADTDCVMYARDMTHQLDIDPARYGAWKLEAAGERYRIIAKKVYAAEDMSSRSAKGMRVGDLKTADFDAWLDGQAPEQDQLHLARLLQVLDGAPMYRTQHRRGTAIQRKAA